MIVKKNKDVMETLHLLLHLAAELDSVNFVFEEKPKSFASVVGDMSIGSFHSLAC